ncbi:MAG: hypothetical protein AAF330_02065 [Pseudomonadota bacterium]
MNAGASITPQDVRAYANLPSEVPEALLAKHIEIAVRDLARDTGLEIAPAHHAEEWVEALTVCALASVYTWLNTFALDGAAKVGRLEGSVEYRFLDAEDVERRIDRLCKRYSELVANIKPIEPQDTPESEVELGSISMISI